MARERTGVCTQHLPFPLCVCPVYVKRGQIRMLFLSTQYHATRVDQEGASVGPLIQVPRSRSPGPH